MINTNNIDLKNIQNIKKTKRYQLIKPIVSHKIYETHSFNRASKKCYDELKALNMLNVNSFTIRDIDTNAMFTFKIHDDTKQIVQKQLQSTQHTVNSAKQLNSNLKINPTIPDRIDRSDINNLIHINSYSASTGLKQVGSKQQIGGGLFENDPPESLPNVSDQPIQLPLPTIDQGETYKIELLESKVTNHDLRITNLEKELANIKDKREDQCVIC